MTTTQSTPTDVVVVDGSNIATEGRSMPSLSQLNDAVMAFRAEFPDAVVTVVVDATFGHRIDKSEVPEFDDAVAHNELVAPPAGAIGRGDAFVLSIANKVGARILSNDSFQEFHGQYSWLFDEGRLIGGKPVPYVGWVFVPRLPVKGPASRKATRARGDGRNSGRSEGRGDGRSGRRTANKAASLPMPVPSAPPPGRSRRTAEPSAAIEPRSEREAATAATPAAPKPVPAGQAVNSLLPFIDFVERHPVGSSVNGVVESYSSHGAYVTIGDLRGYVPLRLMGDPPPRRAREVLKIGDAVTLVVDSLAPGRRSVDLALPPLAGSAAVQDPSELVAEVVEAATQAGEQVAAATPARRGRSRRAAAPASVVVPADAPSEDAPSASKPRGGGGRRRGVAPADGADDSTVSPAARARRSKKVAAAPPEVLVIEATPAEKPTRSRKKAAASEPTVSDMSTAGASPIPPTRPAKKAAAARTPSAPTATKAPAKATAARSVSTKVSSPAEARTATKAPKRSRRRRR